MAAFVSMLRTTRDHAREQSLALAARAKSASAALASETKEAGTDVARFVRLEARRWRRYVRANTAKVTVGARALFAPRTVERELLARVDGTLRALDVRVTHRLDALGTSGARGKARAKSASTKRTPKRKAPAARPSGTTLIAGGRKHAG